MQQISSRPILNPPTKNQALWKSGLFSKGLPEELVIAFRATKFWISQADLFKPGTVYADDVLGATVGAHDLIHAIRHRDSHLGSNDTFALQRLPTSIDYWATFRR